MATLQDRNNPSRKARVTVLGEQVFIGPNSDGSIKTTESGDESLIIDDVTTANMTYFCYATPGTPVGSASWKIKRIDETLGYPVIEYADGDDEYNNVASTRASHSYS